MHENKFAHRDIKPANIVLMQDRTYKFIDFGGCIKYKKNK